MSANASPVMLVTAKYVALIRTWIDGQTINYHAGMNIVKRFVSNGKRVSYVLNLVYFRIIVLTYRILDKKTRTTMAKEMFATAIQTVMVSVMA